VVDVQVPRPAADGHVSADEAAARDTSESRERLVAAHPAVDLGPDGLAAPQSSAEMMAAGAVDVEVLAAEEDIQEAPHDSLVPEADVEDVSHETLAAEQDVEEAPISSRRPVEPPAEQKLADMAFGEVEPRPPRHTPPPESGRLRAAPPAADFDGEVTGVREAPVAAPPETVAAAPRSRPTPGLAPQATTASLEASDAVAEVVTSAQAFGPTTFVALLDASLAL
jgi:hypothetical protein